MLRILVVNEWRVVRNSAAALMCAIMAGSVPALANGSSHPNLQHVERVEYLENSAGVYGPAVPGCDQVAGGPACLFIDFTSSGTFKENVNGRGKVTETGTVLLYLTPNGAHDANGNPTAYCIPIVGSVHSVYSSGDSIDTAMTGTECGAGPDSVGILPSVFQYAGAVTGGTGKFSGVRGSFVGAGAGYQLTPATAATVTVADGALLFPN